MLLAGLVYFYFFVDKLVISYFLFSTVSPNSQIFFFNGSLLVGTFILLAHLIPTLFKLSVSSLLFSWDNWASEIHTPVQDTNLSCLMRHLCFFAKIVHYLNFKHFHLFLYSLSEVHLQSDIHCVISDLCTICYEHCVFPCSQQTVTQTLDILVDENEESLQLQWTREEL